jgi:hypothetical protein
MEYKIGIGNITIFQNEPINNSIIKWFKDALDINSRIFKIRLKKRIKVYFCSNYSEIYEHAKVFHKWSTASIEKNKMIFRTVGWIEKIGKFTKKDIRKIIIHEFNHIFWLEKYKLTKPNWLIEGFASYVAGESQLNKQQLKKLIRDYSITNTAYLHYRLLRRNYKSDYPRYYLWAGFTKFLVKSYSIRHILLFMDYYAKNPKKSNYHKSFFKVFNKGLNELFNNFLSSIN